MLDNQNNVVAEMFRKVKSGGRSRLGVAPRPALLTQLNKP